MQTLEARGLTPAMPMTDDILRRLAETIRERRRESAAKSYTRQLLDAGAERCAKKLGEEATETVIAAVSSEPEALTREAADLIYHLMVVLESRGVDWCDVVGELERRMGTSGLAEKAARPGSSP